MALGTKNGSAWAILWLYLSAPAISPLCEVANLALLEALRVTGDFHFGTSALADFPALTCILTNVTARPR
jgi:hypothetical protein